MKILKKKKTNKKQQLGNITQVIQREVKWYDVLQGSEIFHPAEKTHNAKEANNSKNSGNPWNCPDSPGPTFPMYL